MRNLLCSTDQKLTLWIYNKMFVCKMYFRTRWGYRITGCCDYWIWTGGTGRWMHMVASIWRTIPYFSSYTNHEFVQTYCKIYSHLKQSFFMIIYLIIILFQQDKNEETLGLYFNDNVSWLLVVNRVEAEYLMEETIRILTNAKQKSCASRI